MSESFESLDWVRTNYAVPAEVGMRVKIVTRRVGARDARTEHGTIVGGIRQYVGVRFDGDEEASCCHPLSLDYGDGVTPAQRHAEHTAHIERVNERLNAKPSESPPEPTGGEATDAREWRGLDRAAVESCGLRIRADDVAGVHFEVVGARGGVKWAVVLADQAAELYRDDLMRLLPAPTPTGGQEAARVRCLCNIDGDGTPIYPDGEGAADCPSCGGRGEVLRIASGGQEGCEHRINDGTQEGAECPGEPVERLAHVNDRIDWMKDGTRVCARHLAEHQAESLLASGQGAARAVSLALREILDDDAAPLAVQMLRQAIPVLERVEAGELSAVASDDAAVEEVAFQLASRGLWSPATRAKTFRWMQLKPEVRETWIGGARELLTAALAASGGQEAAK